MKLFAAIFVILPFLSLALAQSALPSPTPPIYRRAPGPLPTSLEQIRDPDLLAAIQDKPIARSRRRKIHGFGHEADQLPLTNAERLRLNLPLKPPQHKQKKGQHHTDTTPEDLGLADDEGEDLGDWLENNHPF